jgi:glycosyltransferase involved in cell wall biosynthesis
MQSPHKLSIIVPAYKEAKTIRLIIEKILSVNFPIDYEILIIDDHSTDRTYRIARILNRRDFSQRIRLFHNEENCGKGYCIRRGFQEAAGDILVVQDADFEYDPAQIPALLVPILAGKAQVVYGSRFLHAAWPVGMALPNCAANRILTFATNLLFGSRLTDMETCYKVIKKEVMGGVRLKAQRFDFEPEITASLLKKGVDIVEYPITYCGRTHQQGKKIKAKDFFIAVRTLLSCRFSATNR